MGKKERNISICYKWAVGEGDTVTLRNNNECNSLPWFGHSYEKGGLEHGGAGDYEKTPFNSAPSAKTLLETVSYNYTVACFSKTNSPFFLMFPEMLKKD